MIPIRPDRVLGVFREKGVGLKEGGDTKTRHPQRRDDEDPLIYLRPVPLVALRRYR